MQKLPPKVTPGISGKIRRNRSESPAGKMLKWQHHENRRGKSMEKILEWLNSNIPVVTGAAFAFCISLLTVREGSFRERLTKATLCSIFSTGIFYGMVSIFPTCPPEAAVAIGSFVGFYGVDQTKALILDKITALTGKKTQPETNQHDDVI